jgi:hypothetical protein
MRSTLCPLPHRRAWPHLVCACAFTLCGRMFTVCVQVAAVPLAGMFGLCVIFLGISLVCQLRLEALAPASVGYHRTVTDEESSEHHSGLKHSDSGVAPDPS